MHSSRPAVLTLNPRAGAMPLPEVVSTIAESGGHYRPGGASLAGADCSGLVSVAQSLAMGEPVRRLGSTHTLLAGAWPHAIPGATRDDRFVIGVNPQHMVARVGGVRIEATCCGRPFKVGPSAASPFDPQFTQYRIDEAVLA
ncbi:MAG: hypothetical protein K0U84_18615 [Actinomycetia bacterium]|nr:hypothetical protein [Actinomycetes bacterium]